MENNFTERINFLKNWLGTGSINVFGLPMSGKDTVGVRLAEDLGAKFLSSGMMIRAIEQESKTDLTSSGLLVPTDLFYNVVLPYFDRDDVKGFPLILSSVGRWFGEETVVMEKLEQANHKTACVILLDLSEQDVISRWEVAQELKDRGARLDDNNKQTFLKRIQEFKEKTSPVLDKYNELGLLVRVDASPARNEVYEKVIEGLYNFAKTQSI